MTAPSVQEQLQPSLQHHCPSLSSQLSSSQRQGPSPTQAASTHWEEQIPRLHPRAHTENSLSFVTAKDTSKIPATSLTNRQCSEQSILSQFHHGAGKDSQKILSP